MWKTFNDLKRDISATKIRITASKVDQEVPAKASKPKKLIILGRFPTLARSENIMYTKRCNRYLIIQENRIMKEFNMGNYNKLIIIGSLIFRDSMSYQTVLFNRCVPGGYWKMSNALAVERLVASMKMIRTGDLRIFITRFYIEKKNGKLRPIGAPSITGKMISKFSLDMTNLIFSNSRNEIQHGYRNALSTQTAIKECIKKVLAGYKIIEFDFRSFFNTVTLTSIFKKLGSKSDLLAYFITGIISKSVIHFPEGLKEESEYKKGGLLYLNRYGVPQGLSLSPLLATLVLEDELTPENLVMYADDGLMFYKNSEEEKKFHSWIQRLYGKGISVEMEKTQKIVESKFNFLGIEFDTEKKMLYYKESMISMNSPGLDQGLKQVTQGYSKEKNAGTGEIADESIITKYSPNISLGTGIITVGKGFMYAEMYKGYRYFGGYGVKDILGASTMANEMLIKQLNQVNLGAKGGINLTGKFAFNPYIAAGKKYIKQVHIGPPNYQPGKK